MKKLILFSILAFSISFSSYSQEIDVSSADFFEYFIGNWELDEISFINVNQDSLQSGESTLPNVENAILNMTFSKLRYGSGLEVDYEMKGYPPPYADGIQLFGFIKHSKDRKKIIFCEVGDNDTFSFEEAIIIAKNKFAFFRAPNPGQIRYVNLIWEIVDDNQFIIYDIVKSRDEILLLTTKKVLKRKQ